MSVGYACLCKYSYTCTIYWPLWSLCSNKVSFGFPCFCLRRLRSIKYIPGSLSFSTRRIRDRFMKRPSTCIDSDLYFPFVSSLSLQMVPFVYRLSLQMVPFVCSLHYICCQHISPMGSVKTWGPSCTAHTCYIFIYYTVRYDCLYYSVCQWWNGWAGGGGGGVEGRIKTWDTVTDSCIAILYTTLTCLPLSV